MLMITSGLIISFLGTWSGVQVTACGSKDATLPPPLICTYGDTIEDDTVDPPEVLNKTKEEDKPVVPSTVYVQVMVLIDNMLYKKLGEDEEKVKLYVRKFMSAVNIKFQGQFKTPKIKFVIREVFKYKTHIFNNLLKTHMSFYRKKKPKYCQAHLQL